MKQFKAAITAVGDSILVTGIFFVEVYDLSRQEGWTSNEHFTADGTLIESWASLKSFVRKDGGDQKKVASANQVTKLTADKKKVETDNAHLADQVHRLKQVLLPPPVQTPENSKAKGCFFQLRLTLWKTNFYQRSQLRQQQQRNRQWQQTLLRRAGQLQQLNRNLSISGSRLFSPKSQWRKTQPVGDWLS